MNLEGHPVFGEIKLGQDLVENRLPNVAKGSVEVVKHEQSANHVSLWYDNDLSGARQASNRRIASHMHSGCAPSLSFRLALLSGHVVRTII
jgi:hypothetical protein